jgi:predicted CoA-binding protein
MESKNTVETEVLLKIVGKKAHEVWHSQGIDGFKVFPVYPKQMKGFITCSLHQIKEDDVDRARSRDENIVN